MKVIFQDIKYWNKRRMKMNFTNEQLALISTLMYCEEITDETGN